MSAGLHSVDGDVRDRRAGQVERDWPFSEHSRIVVRGGIEWHVQMMGSGPVLLLLHGTGASSHSFQELMPLLSQRFTVIAPDLPGHAFSEVPGWFEPSLPIVAAALDELLTELRVAPVIAVGHSAGAAIVARLALEHAIAPQLIVGLGAALYPFHGLARAVLPSTARILSLASKFLPISVSDKNSVDRILKSTGSTLDDHGLELYRRLSERPSHVAGVLAMMAHWDLEPLYAELPNLATPLLLIAGDMDRAIPLTQQRAVASRMPDARVVVVRGAGHLLHEEQPETVARLILNEAEIANERTTQ